LYQGLFHQFSLYVEDFPAFQKPPSDTLIEYPGIEKWDEYKKKKYFHWKTRYPTDGTVDSAGLTHPPASWPDVDDPSDPPPPYEP